MAKVYVADTSKSVSYTFATSIFFSIESRVEKKKRNTFLAHFTCLTFCFGSYNSTCKSPTILYKALVGYPSLGRHQTLEVATEYLFGAQVGIEYCTMMI